MAKDLQVWEQNISSALITITCLAKEFLFLPFKCVFVQNNKQSKEKNVKNDEGLVIQVRSMNR